MMKAKGFPGGVHPAYNKEATNTKRLERPPLFERYILPLTQHIGAPARPVVKKGDPVFKGTLLAEPGGFVSASIHSPTSGTVKAVKPMPHPWGTNMMAIEISADGEDILCPKIVPNNTESLDPGALRKILLNSGLVGMGGAAFPTHVKLTPPREKTIDTLVLNGAECEPYLTADHRLMVEQARKIVTGARILARILGVQRICIGIEDNKPDAISALQEASEGDRNIEVYSLHVTYPQGAEKQLIFAILRRKVPAGGLPMDVGVVVQNVGTAAAASDAVTLGLPLIERVTTVTGSGIANPGNLVLRVGTLVSDVVVCRGGMSADTVKIINGGPMMGMAMADINLPVLKGSSGLLFLQKEEVVQFNHQPCIRCGHCVDACPMGLLPCIISNFAENELFDELEELNVVDCMECGSCAYVCPSSRILVHHLKRGKAEVIARRRKRSVS